MSLQEFELLNFLLRYKHIQLLQQLNVLLLISLKFFYWEILVISMRTLFIINNKNRIFPGLMRRIYVTLGDDTEVQPCTHQPRGDDIGLNVVQTRLYIIP